MDVFHFYTKLDQALLLGQRAKSIEELLTGFRSVPDSSIYFHTHRFLQQHQFFSPEPPNDFAFWVTNVLGDDALGERLWSVDTIRFSNISELRDRLIGILEIYLNSRGRTVECQAGEEFHFMACRTFVLPTAYIAHDLREFSQLLPKVSIGSVYFHMFDAKLRLKTGENDFSRWFRDLGHNALANETQRLDPYSFTLDGLRQRIIALVRQHDSH
jgi:hypothetical protein